MKYIFLDIDGVLNCDNTTQRCCGMPGIDPECLKHLKYIVEQTHACIVLTSTWKYYWDSAGTPGMEEMCFYLNTQFMSEGLKIIDRTEDMGYDRGQGIIDFLICHPSHAWVVLDDEFFGDYEVLGIRNHLVLTGQDGLTHEHAIQAINILKEELQETST